MQEKRGEKGGIGYVVKEGLKSREERGGKGATHRKEV